MHRDKTQFIIWSLSFFFIAYMLVSLFYLYVAVGESINQVSAALFNSQVLGALTISVASAFLVGGLAVAIGVPVAYFMAFNEFRGKETLEMLLIDMPQTFPPVTEGLVYLLMLGRFRLAYTFAAVIIAKFYVSAPFTLSFLTRRFRELKGNGYDVIARSLGARTRHVLNWIMIPLSARDVVGGFSLTWARAMGELAATLVFAGAIPWQTEIIPTLVFLTSRNAPAIAMAASVIAETLSLVALFSFRLIGRGRKWVT